MRSIDLAIDRHRLYSTRYACLARGLLSVSCSEVEFHILTIFIL